MQRLVFLVSELILCLFNGVEQELAVVLAQVAVRDMFVHSAKHLFPQLLVFGEYLIFFVKQILFSYRAAVRSLGILRRL